jgi:hypothetical protein
MTHTIPVPERLQRPTCTCGWSPTGPWRCSWDQFDADAEAHLTQAAEQAHADEVARRHPNQHTASQQESGRI